MNFVLDNAGPVLRWVAIIVISLVSAFYIPVIATAWHASALGALPLAAKAYGVFAGLGTAWSLGTHRLTAQIISGTVAFAAALGCALASLGFLASFDPTVGIAIVITAVIAYLASACFFWTLGPSEP